MAYTTTAGATTNASKGGEYDNTDETSAASYENLAAAQADAAAASATAAANSATAAAGSATTASNAATTATTQAGIATTQAGIATTQASNASASAATATTQAGVATTQAGIATTQATNAATSASTATTQAGIATTQATNAATSASTATTQAGIATTQAGIATTQASNAANSASTASTQAGIATTQATNASNSATSASTSATTATTQAGIATTQAGIATTQATNASTYATNASNSASASATSATNSAASASTATTQATNASNSATSASASATAAAASYDSFDDRYLGAKTSDPTVDNDGNALITGAMYFNSTSSIMKVYTGSAWMNTPGIATGGSAGQVLAKLSSTNYDTQWVSLTGGLIYGGTWNASTNTPTLASGVGTQGTYYVVSVSGSTNLDGVTDWVIGDWAIFNGTAWQKIDQTNLVTSVAGRTGAITLSNTDISGLGTAATQNSTAFATAAQGILADNAISSITSADGSVVISPTGTVRDLSVGTALNTATLIAQVRNETGATLTKGTVVYVSGAASNKALVSKAIANADATSAQTFGVIQADISNNNNGYVVVTGVVSGLNTSAFANGTQLYLSGTTAGTYTSTKPYAPIHLVYVGIVTYSHVNQGTIEVKIQNGYEMDELHDVSAQSPTNNDTLVYNSSTSLWTKTAQSALTAGNVSGTVAIANGGTGQTTANTAFNALAPSQTSNTGKYLTTDGTSTSWATVDALPSQTGNANKYLKTDGTTATWETVVTGGGPITQNADSVSTNQTIAAGSNGFSVGPMTIQSGYSVNIASGQRWVVI